MNRYISPGFVCSLLLLSLAGACMAEETPNFLVDLSGEESILTNESDGIFSLMIQNITPYYNITIEESNYAMPVDSLVNTTDPLNAAIVFPDSEGESVSLVTVTNVSFSDEKNVLILEVTPLEFYDGTVLATYAKESVGLDTLQKERFDSLILYLEMQGQKQENTYENCCGDGYSFFQELEHGTGNYCCETSGINWCKKIYSGPCS